LARLKLYRDPRVFADYLVRPAPKFKTFLGIDPGTRTGIAYAHVMPGQPIDPARLTVHYGQWDLSAHDLGDSGAIKFVKLRAFLAQVDPDLIVLERIRNTPKMPPGGRNAGAIVARALNAAEPLVGYMATICTWAEERDVPCEGIDIAAIKKRATGRGNSNKEDVIRAANEMFGCALDPETYEQTGADNMADALFCLLIGLEAYADGIPDERSNPGSPEWARTGGMASLAGAGDPAGAGHARRAAGA